MPFVPSRVALKTGADIQNESAERLRILVVDDVEPVARVLVEGLVLLNQDAICALSGREALRVFTTVAFDAVVCDLELPDLSGWDVGKRISQLCAAIQRPKPVFVLMTGWTHEAQDHKKIVESGVDAVLGKPCSVMTLLEVLRKTFVGTRAAK